MARTSGPFFIQDVIDNVCVAGEFDDKLDIVPGKQIIVVGGGEETLFFCKKHTRGIGFQVCHRNDPGVYFFELVLIDEIQ